MNGFAFTEHRTQGLRSTNEMPLSSLLRRHELHRPQLEADCASGVRGTSRQGTSSLDLLSSCANRKEPPASQGPRGLAVKALCSTWVAADWPGDVPPQVPDTAPAAQIPASRRHTFPEDAAGAGAPQRALSWGLGEAMDLRLGSTAVTQYPL